MEPLKPGVSHLEVLNRINLAMERVDNLVGNLQEDPPDTSAAKTEDEWINGLVTPLDTCDPGDCCQKTSFQQCADCRACDPKAACSDCPGNEAYGCPMGDCDGKPHCHSSASSLIYPSVPSRR
jgi:hypothetical protein